MRSFLLFLLPTLGCEVTDDLFGGSDVPYVDPCLESGTVASLGGVWTLGGSGSRNGCPASLETLNTGSFVIKMPGLTVSQAADGKLSATVPVPAGVTASFSGAVRGTCLTAKIVETDARGTLPVVRTWEFDGDTNGTLVSGDFTLAGPETCSGSGTFSLSVR